MAPACRAIQDFADALHQTGRTLLLCGALPQPARLMSQAEFHRHVGAANILPNVDAALRRAEELWRLGEEWACMTRAPGAAASTATARLLL